ncbi:MAG: DUF504 domain-containing protein [Candidatus Thermoplasmatota archaeon]|nr:DUF504 domain-containing protein [Candidatus Thermoplasmatota archaeon]
MPILRDIFNTIKWTKDLKNVEIWYTHRGAPNNMKCISGVEILDIGRSFLQTTTASLPYHRILKISYDGVPVFDRLTIKKSDKQL